jgi:uncharacterized protein YraI
VKRLLPVLAILAFAAMACNLGTIQPSPTPRATFTVQPTIQPTATVQPTNTVQPTLASGSNSTPIIRANSTAGAGFCAASLPVRLMVGGQGRVTPGDANVIRSQPTRDNSSSRVLGQIPAGGVFTVLAGPQCANNLTWWQVNYKGAIGWTPEGEGRTYWLEPVTTSGPIPTVISTPNTACPPLARRLSIGGQGRVTPGQPNVMRNGAGKTGTTVVGQIPAGGVFNVTGGPVCADDIVWWQVIYAGVQGWTGEGQGSTYWTEPVTAGGNVSTCDGISPARVKMGYLVRVINPDPLPMFGSPTQAGNTVIGAIPPGATLTISGSSLCDNGTRFWQAIYNGTSGWVAEVAGLYTPYYITPTSAASGNCPNGSAPKLLFGSTGRVTPGQPNAMRTGPAKTGTTVVGQIPADGVFTVLDGPICADGFRWWKVAYGEQIGWTPDGDGASYWVEPLADAAPCPFVPRLTVGALGRVTPGQPNRIRSAPSMTQSSILGQIPAGATFSVVDGPRCLNGSRWWQVTYNGITGWTADADASGYWIEPYLP